MSAKEKNGGCPQDAEQTKENVPDVNDSKKTRKRKFPSWMDLFATIGVFIVSALLGYLVAMILMHARGAKELTPDLTLIYYLIQMIPPVLFVVWLRHRAGRGNAIHFGFRRTNLPLLLWGILFLLASSVVLEPLLSLFPSQPYDAVKNMVGTGGWTILSVIICAPILEEILFRGLILESCRERFGGALAVLISSLLFGLIHGIPVQIVNAFVVGLILGYIYIRTGSLITTIILHAINNAIAYVSMAYFGADADKTLRELIPDNKLYWAIYAAAAVIFVYAMVKLVINLHKNTELE